MEAPDRQETECELAAAILLLWILFSDIRHVGPTAYQLFMESFNRLARPILTRIYGSARAALADTFGLAYPTRPIGSGDGQTILVPGQVNRVIFISSSQSFPER